MLRSQSRKNVLKMENNMDTVQKKWETLRDEGLAEMNAPIIELTRPQDIDPSIRLSMHGWVRGWTDDPNWINYGLVYNSKLMKTNGSKCPKSLRIMRNLMKKRKVIMAGYSLLKPRSKIPKHTDQKDGTPYDVYHIGLSVPDPTKCLLGVRRGVETIIHNHKNGELICFDDRVEHWALNTSHQNRLVFYIKCLKEL
jgi:aspartyl/asparaginyl beta-hydroxylase (cupin superfamily)